MFKLAIQLYSLREYETDLDGMFAKIKEAGYDGVEAYFYLYGMTAAQLRERLDKAGLECVSMHVDVSRFKNDIDGVIADANALGASMVAIPFMEWEAEADALDIAAIVRANSAKIKAGGLMWLYHNHSHEFKKLDNGKDFFDVLLPNTDSGQINLQLDTYWAEQAGVPVASFIERAGERIGGFHLKDKMEIGSGNIDFEYVLKTAKKLGHKWLVVEQEGFDKDPYESIRISREFVENIAKGV